MEKKLSDKDRKILTKYTISERKKGVKDADIIRDMVMKGVSQKNAQLVVEGAKTAPPPSPAMVEDTPSMSKAVLGLIAGIVVFIVGIGITMASNGQKITYGAILVGFLWIIRGAINVYSASQANK